MAYPIVWSHYVAICVQFRCDVLHLLCDSLSTLVRQEYWPDVRALYISQLRPVLLLLLQGLLMLLDLIRFIVFYG